jgi:poly-gamma-glutamate synthesis protein (capsule biosynthesis protein)
MSKERPEVRNTAGLWPRALAYGIDIVIAFALYALVQLPLIPVRNALGIGQDWFQSGVHTEIYTLLTISLPIWLFFALFDRSARQGTPGKWLLHLRVVSIREQSRIRFPRSLARSIVKLLPWECVHLANNLPEPIWYAEHPGFRIGFALSGLLWGAYALTTALTRNRQAPHDLLLQTLVVRDSSRAIGSSNPGRSAARGENSVRLFLAGDVMTGRGIDQIMPFSVGRQLHEPRVKRADKYVELAVKANGSLPEDRSFDYIWGDALDKLDRAGPDFRIINLETAVTTSDEFWPGKKIHYRMHPSNVECLRAARIDCCSLANNHVLDWGYAGLEETLETLRAAGMQTAGAGMNRVEAERPAVFHMDDGRRLLLFSAGTPSSYIDLEWAATDERPGVNMVDETDPQALDRLGATIRAHRRPEDRVVLSIHWGLNWDAEIHDDQQRLARALIDKYGVDLIYGHSSHHVKGLEVYNGKLILYGCGDLITDYEGIGHFKRYRGDLGLLYFADIDRSSGALSGLVMAPTQMKQLRLTTPSRSDIARIRRMLRSGPRRSGPGIASVRDSGTGDRLLTCHPYVNDSDGRPG